MAFNINEFKSQLTGGGARANLFQVQILNPIDSSADLKSAFMIKTAALPESTVGEFVVPYFGREVKYAGDRKFGPWSVTILNDEDFLVRNSLEAWMNAINSHDSNTRALPQDYKSNALITQYGKDGSALRTYVFEGMFPVSVDAIAMGWDTNDAIQEFGVTFSYDLWKVEGNTGNPTT